MISISIRNTSAQRSQTTRRAVLDPEFKVRRPDGTFQTYTFVDDEGRPARLVLPQERYTRQNPWHAHNLESLRAFIASRQQPIAEHIVIDDPEAEEIVKAKAERAAARLVSRLTDLYESGEQGLKTLGNFLRRKTGSVQGMTPDAIYNALCGLARTEPRFIQDLLDEKVSEVVFLVDRAVEARLLTKRLQEDGTDFYTHVKSGKSWGSLQQLVYHLEGDPSGLADTLRFDLGQQAQAPAWASSPALSPPPAAAGGPGPGEEDPQAGAAQRRTRAEAAVDAAIGKGLIVDTKSFGRFRDDILGTSKQREALVGDYADEKNASYLAQLEELIGQ